MRVVFTARAETQIDALYNYIADHAGERRAEAYVERIVRYCQSLETVPKRGTRRDDILPGLRIIGFERRVTIAFMVTEDRVVIEGIFYGGQAFEKTLRGDDKR